MKLTIPEILFSLGQTILFLIVCEISTSAILPAMGLDQVKLAFHVLIVLYLAFKINVHYIPYLILSVEYTHSFFSIEGWAISTIIGIIVSFVVGYLKDVLHFTNALFTMFIVQVFQTGWFLIVALLLSLKQGTFENFFSIFFGALPDSIITTIISPIVFKLLDRFWISKDKSLGVMY